MRDARLNKERYALQRPICPVQNVMHSTENDTQYKTLYTVQNIMLST